MAYTAHKDEESMQEHYETPEELSEKVLMVNDIRRWLNVLFT